MTPRTWRRAWLMAAMAAALPCVVAASLIPRTAHAQGRELSWPSIDVTAFLDADGVLHVNERQEMWFTGDWNGGQRRFDVRFGQSFELRALRRLDTTSGRWLALVEGGLERVDEWAWAEGRTLRWRSRLPDDPPFEGASIDYELDYAFGRILVPRRDGTYLLDHDFAFADREGDIDRFTLALTLDPAWRAPEGFTGRFVVERLPPGEGFVVAVPLTRVAAGAPASVEFGAPWPVRQGLLVVLAAALVALVALLLRRERRLGRFAPLPPRAAVTPEFLEHHVLSQLPEVVGAAWDEHTGAAEVAATLARLVQEKKLSSSVKTTRILVFRRDVLHLKLEVPRGQLDGHERLLVDALFDPGKTTTSTDSVRERYAKSGFDPASIIRARLAQLVERTTPGGAGAKPSRRPTVVLILVAVVLLVIGLAGRGRDAVVALPMLGATLVAYGLSAALAAAWQRAISGLLVSLAFCLLPLLSVVAAFSSLVLVDDRFRTGPWTIAGLTVWCVALLNSVCNIARSRQSPERIARRQALAAARAFFRDELRSERPALRDEWFAYLIAFGLGPHIDRWFKAFGGATDAVRAASMAGTDSGSSSSGGGWSGFGGGGGFSGAGASASFAAAVGGMAASVPAPSSSGSSGGGGGGGGSSGGGGGGGW